MKEKLFENTVLSAVNICDTLSYREKTWKILRVF